MHRLRFIFFTILLLLIGCNQQAWFDKFVPKEEAEFSKRFLALFASRDFAAIEQLLDPSLKDPEVRSKLQQVADQFPPSPPVEVEVVGAHTFNSSQRAQYDLTFQYAYPEKWLLANVVLNKQDGRITVAGVHVNLLKDSLQNINRFTFAGKGVVNFVFFALAIAIPTFILVALVLCVRTPIPRRKWLWIVFILFGFVQFSLNWTVGSVNITTLSFLLLGAGFAQAGPAAPYVFTVAIPLGAILFFVKRRRWRAQNVG